MPMRGSGSCWVRRHADCYHSMTARYRPGLVRLEDVGSGSCYLVSSRRCGCCPVTATCRVPMIPARCARQVLIQRGGGKMFFFTTYVTVIRRSQEWIETRRGTPARVNGVTVHLP